MKKHKGFTIVEVLVVVTVIAILASIGIVAYSSVRDKATDAKIRTAVKLAGDAAVLKEARTGSRVIGYGAFNVSGGIQTLVPEYLKPDYRDGATSKKAADSESVFRFYECSKVSGEKSFVIYAALSSPTDEDKASFNRIRSDCGHGDAQAPTSGATVYSYAQLF